MTDGIDQALFGVNQRLASSLESLSRTGGRPFDHAPDGLGVMMERRLEFTVPPLLDPGANGGLRILRSCRRGSPEGGSREGQQEQEGTS